MEKTQYQQAGLLRQEMHATERFAIELKGAINGSARTSKEVETAGLIANINALVDVWERGRMEQLETDFANL